MVEAVNLTGLPQRRLALTVEVLVLELVVLRAHRTNQLAVDLPALPAASLSRNFSEVSYS